MSEKKENRKPLLFLAALLIALTGSILLNRNKNPGARVVSRYANPAILPRKITPGKIGLPPSDAVVLFDGKKMTAWDGAEGWPVAGGVVTAQEKDIFTREHFGDCQFHLEFVSPKEKQADPELRGNSGVYFMGLYEIQILDSFDNPSAPNTWAGAIFEQLPPLVNASLKTEEWQTFDIVFEAPLFSGEKLSHPAFATVFQNGVLVQNHASYEGKTGPHVIPVYTPHSSRLPLMLQGRKSPVRFRNIWIRDLMR